MKLFDIILITLAGLSLFLFAQDVFGTFFRDTNQWIPDVFSESVSWQPGVTFNTVLSAVVSGLFLARFAPQPALIAFLIRLAVERSEIYKLIQASDLMTTFKHLISSWQIAEKYLQAVFILPLVSYFIYLLKRPNREREVILEDDHRL